MECLCGILKDNLKDLVRVAINELSYPCCFNKFVEELEKEEADLNATRNSVQDRVDHGKKQMMKTADVVPKWVEDADKGKNDAENLRKKATTKKSCCFGHCPNWILRYYYGRKLADQKKELEELIKKGESYVQLERVATLPSDTKYFASDKHLKFESRESAYKQIMEAVRDEEVNIIGLYGMGGCGKTTLAEEVKKIAEAEHLFDKVLLVAVSSTVQVGEIHEKIASSMQYTFSVNGEKERATALCERLTQEKKILVILDDVWERLDFGAIGIPLTEHHKGCEVLITTRSEDVCTLMDCQKKIQLQILTDDEAWTLFQKQAHISEDTSDAIKHLAREISDECKGLPVAIAAVAGSLKGKADEIWKVTLNRLRNSKPINIEKGLRDPYKCLQLSYDNLDTEEAKSLFLLCSVFPEDAEISMEDLVRLATGLGVVGEVGSYDEARSEVIAAKIKLVSSCLLMGDAGYDRFVKMHDLVRGVAHFIAKNENKVIKCQLKNDVPLEQHSIRYLWCKEFPNDLDCSNLEFLCIVTKLKILDENFKRMGKLRVLFLTNDARDKRPLSTMLFKTLINLRCLILKRWELSDISFVRIAKQLQSLSLYECSLFVDLQTDDVVKELTNLKLLELIECEMERNSYNMIGRIPQLEELCIIKRHSMWDHWNSDTIEFFKKFGVPQTLQRYVIELGTSFVGEDKNVMFSHEGVLLLGCFDISNETIMGLAKRANVVGIRNIKGGAKNIIPDIFQMKEGRMNKLEICNSEEIKCLVDTTNNNHVSEVGTFFSKLLQLKVNHMNNLRVLWNGYLPPSGTFQKLEELCVDGCPELTSLFTYCAGPFTLSKLTYIWLESCPKLSSLFTISTVKTLTSLKKLNISKCRGLKHIITPVERGHKNEKEDIVEDVDDLQSVNSLFPTLQTLKIVECVKLEVIFPLSRIPELEIIDISECDELKQIMEQESEEDNNLSSHLSIQPGFPKLTKLDIWYCDKLTSLFTSSPGPFTLSKLTDIILLSCPKLTSLFTVSTVKTLTSLERLHISYCEGLKHIIAPAERCHENEKEDIVEDADDLQSVNSLFPTLKTLYIEKCAKLEIIFPRSRIPELESIYIRSCHELKQIMEQESEEDNNLSNPNSLQPRFSKLIKLDVQNCRKLTSLFTRNPGPFTLSKLTELQLVSCPKLSSLFTISTSKTLISLKILITSDCEGLKHIITPERGHKNEKEDIVEGGHDLQSVNSLFLTLKTLQIFKCAKLEVIFPLSRIPELESIEIIECDELKQIMGQSYFPKLTKLCVYACDKLTSVFTGRPAKTLTSLETAHTNEKEDIAKDSHDLPSLITLEIYNCAKLEVIFPLSVSRLSELKSLVIKECKELKQIIGQDLQEDKNSSNLHSLQPRFPKLTKLVVEGCHKLKRVLSTSASDDLSNLETLIIYGADELEELIGCEHGKHHQIEKAEVELPKLKHLIFVNLSNLCQRIGLLAVKHRIVHNCPKLAFTTNTTLREFRQNFRDCDLSWELYELIEKVLSWELPSLQISEESDEEFIEEAEGSEVEATTTSTNIKLVDQESSSEAGFPDQHAVEDTINIEDNIKDPKLEEDHAQSQTNDLFKRSTGANMVPDSQVVEQGDVTDEDCIGTSQCQKIENVDNSIKERSNLLIGQEGEIGVVPNDCVVALRNKELVDRQLMSEPSLMDHQKPLGEILVDQEYRSEAGFSDQHTVEDTINTEEIMKESIQEVPASKGATNKILSTGIEGINMSGGVTTHTSGGDILAQGSQVFEINYKLNESKTVTCTRLAAYKRFVDLDDTQIDLLAEAIAAYPHLWNSCQKYREQFQAWMLKTLADMLLFLRNESASGVTPQRENEFHKLCDEAIKLGFDSSWVDEMRQNFVARDPKLEEDRAQSQVNEFFKRSIGVDMVPDSQVVEEGDGTDEDCTGTSQCQKIQNVDISIKEGSNLLTDKEGEIGVVPIDCIVALRNKELVDRQSMSEPCLMDHQKPLGEIGNSFEGTGD